MYRRNFNVTDGLALAGITLGPMVPEVFPCRDTVLFRTSSTVGNAHIVTVVTHIAKSLPVEARRTTITVWGRSIPTPHSNGYCDTVDVMILRTTSPMVDLMIGEWMRRHRV